MAKRKNRSVHAIVTKTEFISGVLSDSLYDSPWFRCQVSSSTPQSLVDEARSKHDCREDIWEHILLGGGAITITDIEEDESYEIDLKKFERGFKRFMFDQPRHYGDLMTERGDFYTADALLQTIVFGEVVYG